MLENVVETRAKDSTLYNKEAKLRRLKRRIEMERRVSSGPCESVYTGVQSQAAAWALKTRDYVHVRTIWYTGARPETQSRGKLSIQLKCDDDIQSSMSAFLRHQSRPRTLVMIIVLENKMLKF